MIYREQQDAMAVVHMFTITCAKTGGGSMACGHRLTTSATDSRAVIAKFEDEGWRYRSIAKGWLCPHHATNEKGPRKPVRIIRWRPGGNESEDPIVSIGWLLWENDVNHCLTMHLSLDGTANDPANYTTIPKQWVISLMDIRADRPSIDIIAGGWT